MPPNTLANYSAAPFNGPFCQQSPLIYNQAAAPYEGLWTPAQFLKNSSVEIAGTSIGSFEVDIWGTNTLEIPLNTVTITVGGTAHTGDVCALAFANQNLASGSVTPSYTVLNTDTLTTIATALAAAIAGNTQLAALGYIATSSGPVVTVQWPSNPPNLPNGALYQSSPGGAGPSNATTFTPSVTGSGATTTLALANGADGTDLTAITALGVSILPAPVRWLKARLVSLTGAGASVRADLHGAG
jgi:hypothetical protein